MWEYIAYTVYGHIANGMGSCMLSCDFERFWCRLNVTISMIDGYILLRVCKKI